MRFSAHSARPGAIARGELGCPSAAHRPADAMVLHLCPEWQSDHHDNDDQDAHVRPSAQPVIPLRDQVIDATALKQRG